MSRLVDSNVLVFAGNPAAAEHRQALEIIDDVASDTRGWYVAEQNFAEFIAQLTSPALMGPSVRSLPDAYLFADRLRNIPGLRVIGPGPRHWEILGEIIAAPGPYLALVSEVTNSVSLMRARQRLVTALVKTSNWSFMAGELFGSIAITQSRALLVRSGPSLT